MDKKNKEGLEYESKFKSRLQATFDEIQKLKEILFENKIKINEIEERIKSCELAEDLKKKNKIYKKEDKKIYADFLFKLKDSAKEIEYRNKEIIDRIKLKEERIELLRNAQLIKLKKLSSDVKKSSDDIKLQSEEFKKQWTVNASKLAEMYAYINSDASKKDKKVAQVKVYLTEYELKILENLATQRGSDRSSVMRDLLKTQHNIFASPVQTDQQHFSPYQLKVFQPVKFEDIHECVDILDKGESIIVNFDLLKEIEPNISQRCIDFISGAVFRSKGKITEIGSSTIICTTEKSNVLVNFKKESK